MTLAKTHKLVNILLKHKRERKKDLLDPKQQWNSGSDILKDVVTIVVESIDRDIEWIEAIKKQLPPLPKCRHPKKDHDITKNGQRYCMNCNSDLD